MGWNGEPSSTTLGFGPAGMVNEEVDDWLDTSGQVFMNESHVTMTLTLKTFRHSISRLGKGVIIFIVFVVSFPKKLDKVKKKDNKIKGTRPDLEVFCFNWFLISVLFRTCCARYMRIINMIYILHSPGTEAWSYFGK